MSLKKFPITHCPASNSFSSTRTPIFVRASVATVCVTALPSLDLPIWIRHAHVRASTEAPISPLGHFTGHPIQWHSQPITFCLLHWLGGSVIIDSLDYGYFTADNKLAKVTDAVSNASTTLGDFKDGTNGISNDYSYDYNGNLISDSNKHISSIAYNILNLPELITVSGKGTIKYSYDASGNKLSKTTTEGSNVTRTNYMSGFVYQNDTLQFASHAEGRTRYTHRFFVNGDSAWTWQWDYFYKDHLGNIRTVVSEQKDTAKYFASFETASRAKETALFSNIAESAYPIASVTNYPNDATTTPNDYTSRLNGSDRKVGAAITLKVMAGDTIDLGVKYWYLFRSNAVSYHSITAQDIFQTLLGSLTGGVSGLSGGKVSGGDLAVNGSSVYSRLGSFLTSHPEDTTTYDKPRSYLNWVLLDEQFNYVPGNSGFLNVLAYNTDIATLAQSGINIKKSGYLFVYVSNETVGWNVFFDNLVVQHYKGPLCEENSYYSFGLTMSGISSKAFGGVENKYKYNKGSELQNKEFSDGSGLEMYVTNFRSLDPQLGRWWQIDPKPDYAQSLYSAMNNNPISFNDPLGDTVRVDNSITGNKLLNSSFNAFAATKSGNKFLGNYASKGQTVGGITFNKDGKYSKKGVDLNYRGESFEKGKGGETAKMINHGRAQIDISINTNFYGNTAKELLNSAFDAVTSLFHESFLHADLYTKDYLDDGQFNFSNISDKVKNAAGYDVHYQHYQVLTDYMKNGYKTNNLWPGSAFNGLKQLNDILGIYPSDQKLLNEMWNYNGGVQLDENGNVKK